MADDGKCRSGGEPCPRPRAESRFFCAECCVVLDRVGRSLNPRFVPQFSNVEARRAFLAARKAEKAAKAADAAPVPPRHVPSMCRAIGCTRPPRDGETTCYRDRGLPEDSNVRENVCSYPGCERASRSTAGRRCRAHPVADFPAAVAA